MNYYVSDTHFGHSNVLEFERHQFKTIEEHDNYIMTLIENTVKPEDTLYHLGDFAFYLSEDIANRWNALKCYKVLILGNHDKYEFCRHYFDEVHRYPLFISRRILLSHEPEVVSPYVLNVHGHLHTSYLDSKNHYNISIHMVGYNIISQRAIDKKLGALPEMNNNFLAEWYAPLYVFTEPADDRVLYEDGKINIEATKELQKDTWNEVELEDGTKVPVRRLAKSKGRYILYDKDGNYYLSVWDRVEKKEVINRCNVTSYGAPSRIAETWELCADNGKTVNRMDPKASHKERYGYFRVEQIWD